MTTITAIIRRHPLPACVCDRSGRGPRESRLRSNAIKRLASRNYRGVALGPDAPD